MMMYVMKFLSVIGSLMWYKPRARDGLLLLRLPLQVALACEIAIIVLMVRSPENRERLLLSAILLPLHALMYPLLLTFAEKTTAIAFIVIYCVSALILAVGMIAYLICLCRWKRMNRYLWTAAAVWVLYFFASVGSPILFLLILCEGMS